MRLATPIAPGLIDAVGIKAFEIFIPDTVYRPEIAAGALALDGERELTFGEADEVSIRLEVDAFRSVNVSACMAWAAGRGLFAHDANGRGLACQGISDSINDALYP